MVGGSTAAVGLTAGEGGRLEEPRRDWFKRGSLQLALGASSMTQIMVESPAHRSSGAADSYVIHQVLYLHRVPPAD